MTLEEVIAYQAAHDLGHVHVAWLGDTGFHLAHTATERAAGLNTEACDVHCWLAADEPDPDAIGHLVVITPRFTDAYSEDYMAAPYDIEPVSHG